MDIESQFPMLCKAKQIGQLWTNFLLISEINKEECDAEKISRETKSWIILFSSTYQSKDVTPYIHVFRMHVPEFIKLYGSLHYIIPSHSRVWKSSM